MIVRGVGGLYTVLVRERDRAEDIPCRARGAFRHESICPHVGDRVRIEYDDAQAAPSPGVIHEILPRKNLLIRPPIANLHTLFLVLSAARPVTVTVTADKLIATAEHYGVEPVVIVSKASLDPKAAAQLETIYAGAGFPVFVTDSCQALGIDRVHRYIAEHIAGGPPASEIPSDRTGSDRVATGGIAAFAGASGAGKSTLISALFPTLSLRVGEVSQKTGRGRHTTRAVELYPLSEIGFPGASGFLSDTPGFSAMDFLHFDFFELEDLSQNFREFAPYLGECKYKKCTHLCEEGCAIVAAVSDGRIQKSRHDSYRALYAELKKRHPWDKRK